MNTNPNSRKREAEIVEAAHCPVAYATVFKERWERVVKVSKTSLDLAVEENAEVLASYRKAMKVPNPFLFDLAGRALRGYVTFQKSLLDLAVIQSTAGIQATVEPSHDGRKAKSGILRSRNLNSKAAAQTSVVDPVAKQARVGIALVKQKPGITSAPVPTDSDADSVQLRMLAKEIVDLATMPSAKPTIQ